MDPDVFEVGTALTYHRTAKLERLRHEIANGTYIVDLDALACSLVAANACSRQR